MSWRLTSALVVATAAAVGLLWLTDVPLGVPGEWTWNRILVEPEDRAEALFGWLMAAVVGGGYLALAWLGTGRMLTCGRGEAAAWLAALVIGGFGWLWCVQESPAGIYRLQKAPWVLYYRASSGYFHKARHEMDDAGPFLAKYEELVAEGDVLHVGTHPPGLFLFHRGLIGLCEASPELTRVLLHTQPASVAEGFSTIDSRARLTGRPLSEPDQASLWLAALLTQFIAALTVVPLYLLLRRGHSRHASWMAAAFWPLVPALAVFLPKSDALYPCLGLAFLACWLIGRDRRSAVLCLLAGLLFWLGLFFSLAMLPVGLLAVVLTAWELWHGERGGGEEGKPIGVGGLTASLAFAGVGFLSPVVLLWLVWDANLLNVWAWNYRNHAAFYEAFSRTYWKWLLVNPLETVVAAGPPLAVLAAAAVGRTLRSAGERGRGATGGGFSARAAGPCVAVVAVWGLLWLSGKNSGEAARLWLVLMPWLAWLAADCFERPSATADTQSDASQKLWLTALALQMAACIATVTRVYGFDHGVS